MSTASPALLRAAPLHPPSPGPAALAASFVQFLVAVIAWATATMDQMVPRTPAEHARLRRMRRGLALARAMLHLFGTRRDIANVAAGQARNHDTHADYTPTPAPSPWAPPSRWHVPPRPIPAWLATGPSFPATTPPLFLAPAALCPRAVTVLRHPAHDPP